MLSPTGSKDTVFSGPLGIAEATGLTAQFEGDVTVADRLLGCHLQIKGRLNAEKATVSGGSIRAEGEASVGSLGGQDAPPTRLTLLAASGPTAKLAGAMKVLAEESVAIETMQQRIDMLEDDASQFNHTEREEMTLAMFDMPDHQAAIKRLEELTQQAGERFGTETASAPTLTVAQVLHAGVTVAFAESDAVWTCREDLTGPVQISVDDENVITATFESGEVRQLDTDRAGEQEAEASASDAA